MGASRPAVNLIGESPRRRIIHAARACSRPVTCGWRGARESQAVAIETPEATVRARTPMSAMSVNRPSMPALR